MPIAKDAEAVVSGVPVQAQPAQYLHSQKRGFLIEDLLDSLFKWGDLRRPSHTPFLCLHAIGEFGHRIFLFDPSNFSLRYIGKLSNFTLCAAGGPQYLNRVACQH
ncbi:MAG: hypothetical protein EA384_03200 [Spirochaetaceae bacterium]|nr:MAG: hypothetical protein EA384_03200 [Spirochaetaceae bacterium]